MSLPRTWNMDLSFEIEYTKYKIYIKYIHTYTIKQEKQIKEFLALQL